MNAMRHGVFADRPVVVLAESAQAYDEHRAALCGALAPVGYLEAMLVERVASISWRLRRLERWEATAADAALGEVAEKYRSARERGSGVRSTETAESLEQTAHALAVELGHVEAFAAAVASGTLDALEAAAAQSVALAALAELGALESDDGEPVRVFVPGIDAPLGEDDGVRVVWTGPLAWAAIEAVQAELDAAGEPNELPRWEGEPGPAYRLRSQRFDAQAASDRAARDAAAARALHRRLEAAAVLNETRMESVSRYETFLERGLARTLATLRDAQATRATRTVRASIVDDEGET